MNSLIDSHCHLYYEPYINNIQLTIEECRKNNVNKLLTIGVDVSTSKKNIELANRYKEVYCTIGIHPNSTNNINKKDINILEKLLTKSNKILGIGETGLDYFRDYDKKKQIYSFERHVEISKQNNLPIIIHSRNAEIDTLSIIKKHKTNEQNFVIHCFSGSADFAKKCLEMGCYISFSGILTFKNVDYLRKICEFVPDNKLLIETDSPYLSPEPYRGRVNHPKNVKFVAEEISKIRDCSLENICQITSKNFKVLFGV